MERLCLNERGAVHVCYQGNWYLLSPTQVVYVGNSDTDVPEYDFEHVHVVDDITASNVRDIAKHLTVKAYTIMRAAKEEA